MNIDEVLCLDILWSEFAEMYFVKTVIDQEISTNRIDDHQFGLTRRYLVGIFDTTSHQLRWARWKWAPSIPTKTFGSLQMTNVEISLVDSISPVATYHPHLNVFRGHEGTSVRLVVDNPHRLCLRRIQNCAVVKEVFALGNLNALTFQGAAIRKL
jgi:hypothetical protein